MTGRMTGRIFIKLIRHPPLHQKAATFAGEATYNKAVVRHRLRTFRRPRMTAMLRILLKKSICQSGSKLSSNPMFPRGILIQAPSPSASILSLPRNKTQRADFFNRILWGADRQLQLRCAILGWRRETDWVESPNTVSEPDGARPSTVI
jgi:hypothetical protein